MMKCLLCSNEVINVSVDYVLKNKDRVLLKTDVNSYGARENWLNIAQTGYAKRKIMEFGK